MAGLKFNRKAFSEIAKRIIETEGVERMQRVADAANARIESDGFMVSVEGDDPLDKRDYRATVITANAEAMRADRKHDILLSEFSKAGGK
ncbi:hypothetical protein [Mycobacterium sp. CnD-18-1]|uniref:hypothetical protein n=1 Tax=Mycobacterium sp. CnD-18-1 TaxID=2917744 RepID=UPI001EF1669B|nr:hypothetical protein [Mycobacterium sp. CnD-18-1]MCG7607089.1 hypothetical protein [Mycobacterium sp. CnD-18-1]